MEDQKKVTRRQFLQQSASGLATITSASLLASCSGAKDKGLMPKRKFGNTGLEVSILAFGGGSYFLKNKDGEWEPMLERAIEAGINYFDTSQSYHWGAALSSEERFGLILPKYRDEIILSTKFDSRDVNEAMKMVDRALKRLKTDYLDVLMIHSIEPSDDLDIIENGVYKELIRLKEEGVARFIGFSSMDSSQKAKAIIERLDFDVAMLAMNATKYGDYAEVALPAARKKNMGVIAMKAMRDIIGKGATPEELLHYEWSLEGVASAVVAHDCMEAFEDNIRIAKQFGSGENVTLNKEELERKLAHLAGPHALCWARPDYYDGMMV
ncbi:aldo/keto reductase [candidate division KSB1 bacterium]|nr:aldo/keto reductase [candidate division KSB1 bacterium]